MQWATKALSIFLLLDFSLCFLASMDAGQKQDKFVSINMGVNQEKINVAKQVIPSINLLPFISILKENGWAESLKFEDQLIIKSSMKFKLAHSKIPVTPQQCDIW